MSLPEDSVLWGDIECDSDGEGMVVSEEEDSDFEVMDVESEEEGAGDDSSLLENRCEPYCQYTPSKGR